MSNTIPTTGCASGSGKATVQLFLDKGWVGPGYGPGTNFASGMMSQTAESMISAPSHGLLRVLMGSLLEVTTNSQDVAEALEALRLSANEAHREFHI